MQHFQSFTFNFAVYAAKKNERLSSERIRNKNQRT